MKHPTRNIWGAFYPELDRLILGFLYVPLGIFLHFGVALVGDPNAYNFLGENALLPAYRTFILEIVPLNVQFYALAVALLQLVLGLLIFSRGRWVKVGLLAHAAFQLLVAPMGVWGIANVLLAIMGLMLLDRKFEHSMWAVLTRRADMKAT